MGTIHFRCQDGTSFDVDVEDWKLDVLQAFLKATGLTMDEWFEQAVKDVLAKFNGIDEGKGRPS